MDAKMYPCVHISWYPDYLYLHPGEIYQMEATYKHCDGCILQIVQNDRVKTKWGYTNM